MSVDACKWARMADVQKSSSKLVLLNLAQLVRYDDEAWTAFASIDFLAKVSHLNRKTVIEALGRLRDLGVIQDTGYRAGENRSTIVYRLCPDAVPLVEFPAYGGVTRQDAEMAEAPEDLVATAEASTPPAPPGHQSCPAAQPPSRPARNPTPSVSRPSSPRVSPTRALEPQSGHRATWRPSHSRLPCGWTLPEPWLSWTRSERPHWSTERIQALAATFRAYWRSRPGNQGASADWFESWRLWVFRERESRRQPTAWQNSWSGIVQKGNALTLYQAPNEPDANFKARVYEAAGLPPPY